jgi:hypothetical protein
MQNQLTKHEINFVINYVNNVRLCLKAHNINFTKPAIHIDFINNFFFCVVEYVVLEYNVQITINTMTTSTWIRKLNKMYKILWDQSDHIRCWKLVFRLPFIQALQFYLFQYPNSIHKNKDLMESDLDTGNGTFNSQIKWSHL